MKMENTNKELFQRELISSKQYQFLDSIRTNKIVSLYYELRLMLYLGIMLFTAGIGYFAYQNMGEIGHLIAIALIGLGIVFGFYFIQKFAKPYSNLEVTVNHVYFDYILILVSLLIIAFFTYVQVYFNIVELMLNWTSYITAALFIFMAYRYDNRALLSMSITVLAAAVGISITPINWVTMEWMVTSNLYSTSILLGIILLPIGQVSQYYGVKKHFRFTYQNFGLLLYFIGCISAIFSNEYGSTFALLTVVSAGIITYYTWVHKAFLFFVYANLAGYIAFTYLMFRAIENMRGDYIIFIYYFPVTCIGYLVFIFTKKSHFAHE
jgi:hypothetical protein